MVNHAHPSKAPDCKIPPHLTIATEPLSRNAGGKLLKAQLRKDVTWGPLLR